MYQKFTCIGNLGQDPELRYTQNQNPVCNLSVATTKNIKSADGSRKDVTSWHRVVVWGNQAEACSKFLKKGRQVFVEGEIEYGSYEKDGQKHYTQNINASVVKFLGKGDDQIKDNAAQKSQTHQAQDLNSIPF